MSIVSAKLDNLKARKVAHGPKNPVGAIQWGYDDVPITSSPAQKPTVNQFRKIRVPSGDPRPAPRTNAPVMFKQENADFQVPLVEEYDGTKLKGAEPKVTQMTFEELLQEGITGARVRSREYVEPLGPVPFDYNAGIKPGKPRGITFSDVFTQAGDTFRPPTSF
jgi:hypothetical protein